MKLLTFTLCLFLVIGCTTKHEPTTIGELLTTEQALNLPADNSMDGKIVAIDGYPGLCKRMNLLKINKRNLVSIHTESDCKADELPAVNIYFIDGKGTILFGDEPRNQVIFGDDKKMIFITDDYQKVPEGGMLRFSGKLVYENNAYHLEDISIHQIK